MAGVLIARQPWREAVLAGLGWPVAILFTIPGIAGVIVRLFPLALIGLLLKRSNGVEIYDEASNRYRARGGSLRGADGLWLMVRTDTWNTADMRFGASALLPLGAALLAMRFSKGLRLASKGESYRVPAMKCGDVTLAYLWRRSDVRPH
jgi:hypothetical protein